MCGIVGALAIRSDVGALEPEVLASMVASVRHRGPDGAGAHIDGRVALGHTRLAIIDPATGQQPMSDARGRLWAVFNGEVFNYIELREELRGLGHRFRTQSDTEVVIHAFDE